MCTQHCCLKAGTFFITHLPRNGLANFTAIEYKMKYAFFVCFFFLLKLFGGCQEVMGLWSIKIPVIKVAIRAGLEISDDMSFHWKTPIRQSQKGSY